MFLPRSPDCFSRRAMWTHVPAPPVNLFFLRVLTLCLPSPHMLPSNYLLVNWATNNWPWLFMVDFADDTLLNYIWWLSLFNHPVQFCSYHQGLRASSQKCLKPSTHSRGHYFTNPNNPPLQGKSFKMTPNICSVWSPQKWFPSMTPQQNHDRCKKQISFSRIQN